MVSRPNPPGWSGTKRDADGMTVDVDTTGGWVAVASDGKVLIDNCPCCGKPFATARSAMLVADEVFPVKA